MPRKDIGLRAGLEGKDLFRDIERQSKGGIESGISKANVSLKGINEKAFRLPLGRITGDIGEFQNALEASTARVLAFGASASVLAGISRGLREIVSATIEVEKSLQDINVIFNLSASNLQDFANGLFDVARETSQSFEAVATAATEFARQGLSAEETLRRVRDALILTRLSGLSATESVETLTASVNGFKREAINTTEVINRLANVDAAFAVSSADLANSLSRSGAVAQDAKVSFNELIAATTAVQQATARGGSVIGNAFKTIFTRIQRSSVREVLESIGIATSDLNGNFRSATDILQDYAKVYVTLSDAQKAYTGEQIAGVRQINTLSALVKDLNSEYSVYRSALDVANSSTDQAIQRNAKLNETLGALVEQTKASGTEFAKTFGNLTLDSGIRNLLSTFNNVFQIFEGLFNEKTGSTLARGLLKGIGDFLAGPGLILLGKTGFNLVKFLLVELKEAAKVVANINVGNRESLKIQKGILDILSRDKTALAEIAGASGNRAKQEELILKAVRAQRSEYERIQSVLAATKSVALSGAVVSGKAGGVKARRAAGYIPNFSRQQEFRAEESEARSLGASGFVRARMSQGTIGGKKFILNNQETEIPNFGKNGDSAVIPNYSKGFVPNFAEKEKQLYDLRNPVGVITPFGQSGYGVKSSSLAAIATKFEKKNLTPEQNKYKVTLPIRTGSFEKSFTKKNEGRIKKEAGGEGAFRDKINKELARPITNISKHIFGPLLSRATLNSSELFKNNFYKNLYKEIKGGGANLLAKSAEGLIFESSVRIGSRAIEKGGLKNSIVSLGGPEDAYWDFEEKGDMSKTLRDLIFNKDKNIRRADAKRSFTDSKTVANIFRKYIQTYFGEDDDARYILSILKGENIQKGGRGRRSRSRITKEPRKASLTARRVNKAFGYIPNFAIDPLTEAIKREEQFVPSSTVRVGQSDHFIDKYNPLGLAVTNTRDEPRGVKDVFDNSKKSYSSAASGYIPNFVDVNKKLSRKFQNIQKANGKQATSKKKEEEEEARGGIGGLGAFFAAQSVAGAIQAYAEKEGSNAGKGLAEGITSGLTVGVSASLLGLGGPLSAVVGGLAAVGKAFLEIDDKSDIAQKSLDEFSSKMQTTTDAASRAKDLASQLNDAYRSLDVGRIEKISNAYKDAIYEIEDIDLRGAFLSASGDIDKLDESLRKFSQTAIEEQKRLEKEVLVKRAESLKSKFYFGSNKKEFETAFVKSFSENIGKDLARALVGKYTEDTGVTNESVANIEKEGNELIGILNNLAKETSVKSTYVPSTSGPYGSYSGAAELEETRSSIARRKKNEAITFLKNLGYEEAAKKLENIEVGSREFAVRIKEIISIITTDLKAAVITEEESKLAEDFKLKSARIIKNNKDALDLFYKGLINNLSESARKLNLKKQAFDPIEDFNLEDLVSKGRVSKEQVKQIKFRREKATLAAETEIQNRRITAEGVKKIIPEATATTNSQPLNQKIVVYLQNLLREVSQGSKITDNTITEVREILKEQGLGDIDSYNEIIKGLEDIKDKVKENTEKSQDQNIVNESIRIVEGLKDVKETINRFRTGNIFDSFEQQMATISQAALSGKNEYAAKGTREFLSKLQEDSPTARRFENVLGLENVARSLNNLVSTYSNKDIGLKTRESRIRGVYGVTRSTPQEMLDYSISSSRAFINKYGGITNAALNRAEAGGAPLSGKERVLLDKISAAEAALKLALSIKNELDKNKKLNREGEDINSIKFKEAVKSADAALERASKGGKGLSIKEMDLIETVLKKQREVSSPLNQINQSEALIQRSIESFNQTVEDVAPSITSGVNEFIKAFNPKETIKNHTEALSDLAKEMKLLREKIGSETAQETAQETGQKKGFSWKSFFSNPPNIWSYEQ